MHEFLNSPYAPLVGVMGLLFVIPHVLFFVFHALPEFLMSELGPLGWLLLIVYVPVAFALVVVGVLGGIMSGIIIMFAFMEIIFEAFG